MKKVLLSLILAGQVFAAGPGNVLVSINGMVCAVCAQGIKKTFSKDAAVDKVEVSLEKKLVTLKVKSGKTLTDDTIKTIINDAGYAVEKITRE